MEWLIKASNWGLPLQEAPFSEPFWVQIRISGRTFEGPRAEEREFPPFLQLKTNMPLIKAEMAIHFPVD